VKRGRSVVAFALVLALVAAAPAAAAPAEDLGGRCVAIKWLESHRYFAIDGTRYTANKPSKAGAAAFYLTAGLGVPRYRSNGNVRYWRGRKIDDD